MTSYRRLDSDSDDTLIPFTEREQAQRRLREGARVVEHAGHFWEEQRLGFYQPIHVMAKLTLREVTRPTWRCWGFRAALREEDASTANGAIPVHLLTGLESYDFDHLPKRQRQSLRKCRQSVDIIRLTDPSLLEAQGYDIVLDSLARTRHMTPPSRKAFLHSLQNLDFEKGHAVLGALREGALCGFIHAHAVDDTAYLDTGYYRTDALNTGMVLGMDFEFIQLCRRSGVIVQIMDGFHAREVPDLTFSKEKKGFSVQRIPAFVSLNRGIDAFLRLTRPHTHYRLTGS